MQQHEYRERLAVAVIIAASILFSLPFHAVHAYGAETGAMPLFEALEASPNGKNEIKALENFVDKNPDAEGADEAFLRLGRIYSSKKEHEKGAAAFQKILLNFPHSRFKAEAMYELGASRKKTGRTKEARQLLESAAGAQEAPFTLRAKARALLRETEDASNAPDEKGPPAIGVLLPLRGNYKKYGDEALRGVLLAAGAFSGGKVELLVRDVGPDPASAKAAVEELSANQRVVGLVGPLLNASAVEAARAAQEKRVPIIALAQREGLTDAGDYVFRNFLTSPAQATAIADYAVRTLGVKSFAVMYPSNAYGTELAKLFEKEAFVQGASVAAEMSYAPGMTDFSAQMKQLFNVQVKERREGRRTIKEYEPKLKAEAVFIPDTYEAVSLIAPYFEYYNIRNVRLLGTSALNSARFAELGGKNVEGAVFVDAFYPKSAAPASEAFVRSFVDAFGAEPSAVEAQAFDAAGILISAVTEALPAPQGGASGGTPPGGAANAQGGEAVQARDNAALYMRGVRDFKGATGVISFNAAREAQKRPFILTVKNGEIVEAPAQR